MTAITSRSYTYNNTRMRIPRGARMAAEVFTAGARLLARMAAGTAPSAPIISRAREAADVRDMASRLQATDPGFAADLYAAADRHEKLAD